jgi:lipopolysaccharide assembly outer membrane protein LptD (OstA)
VHGKLMRRLLLLLGLFCVSSPAAAYAQSANPLANCGNDWSVTKEEGGLSVAPDNPNERVGRLTGNVTVVCRDMTLQADEITWRSDSPIIYANGNVHFMQGSTKISAQRGEMNRETKLGTFFEASGSMDILDEKPDRSLFGTQEPYILFWAQKIEKIDDKTYKLTDGGFTSCRQPTPRWDMSASTLRLVPDEYALLRNMVLRVKDVPLFYLPALYYPITKENRATGFLIPTYGQSSIRGLTLSNAFFWALGRSQDVTVYHDYFSKTGQGLGTEYRYAGMSGSGESLFHMINERTLYGPDGETVLQPSQRSFDVRGSINQRIGTRTRVTGRVNYFTNIQTQQLYQQNLYDLSMRTRSFNGAVSSNLGRYRFGAQADRRDVFYGTRAARTGALPLLTFSLAESPIGRTPIYLGAGFSGGYIVRQDNVDDPRTDRSLWRFDGGPELSAPISRLPALNVTASAGYRYTVWSAQLDAEGERLPTPISRQIVNLEARAVGPVLSRIWHTPNNGYASGFKHVIEPTASVGWLSMYDDSQRIVLLDGVDSIVTGTTTVNYGLTNRLLAKRRIGPAGPDGTQPGVVREILTVDLKQTYYTNALAARYDAQYRSSFMGFSYRPSASPFSPVQLSTTARPSDTSSMQFRMEYDTTFGKVRTYGASASIEQPSLDINAGWSKRQFIPDLVGFDREDRADHFLNINTTIRDPDNSIGGAYNFSYDVLRKYYLQRRVRVYFNSQCCGVAFDFQTVDLSRIGRIAYGRADRRVSLSFTLAGLGTFSNPLGSFSGTTGAR